MNKTIKSGAREMLFRMISKFEEKQQEKDAEFKQKQDCLRVVKNFLENLVDVAVYEADELLKQHGHEVLRLPPYHCDFNAIELVWSLAKRKVASKNIALSAVELEGVIKACFETITPEEWKKMTDHVIHVENKYKERDRITENNLESFIINVGNSDSSDSNEYFEMEVLESDFDYDSE